MAQGMVYLRPFHKHLRRKKITTSVVRSSMFVLISLYQSVSERTFNNDNTNSEFPYLFISVGFRHAFKVLSLGKYTCKIVALSCYNYALSIEKPLIYLLFLIFLVFQLTWVSEVNFSIVFRYLVLPFYLKQDVLIRSFSEPLIYFIWAHLTFLYSLIMSVF